MITVYCTQCHESKDEQTVTVLDCSEDFQGRDLLTFTCPDCGTEQRSNRVGRG